ncbi:uncharacterized protein [Ptychodera flava]|uniref:uncharacterized protein n=1 Tax=Ptychodera flava TaxID=63121 RepID=UPI00396A43CD
MQRIFIAATPGLCRGVRNPNTHMFALVLFVACYFRTAVAMQNVTLEKYDAEVLILGAGATGIAAARTFHEHGLEDFLILEGSTRVGGRVKEVEFGGKVLELGANWVQPGDPRVNPVVALAKKYGLKGKVSDWESRMVRNASGNDISKEGTAREKDLDKAMDFSHKLAWELLRDNKSDISLRAALRLGGWNPKTPLDKILEYLHVDFEYGDIPYVTSLKSSAAVNNGKAFFVTDQRGFSYILKAVVDEFIKEGDPRLKFGKVVTHVKWNDRGVEVRCHDGTTYRAPFALLTFSIGVLQNGVVKFEPPMPAWKRLEIEQFDMALYTKIFLKFPNGTKRFWDDNEFILHAHPRRGFYPVWQNLEARGLFDEGTNILLVTVTGEESRRLEYESDDFIKTEVMRVLRHLYGNHIPNAEDITLHRWSQDPLFFGAYSNWPVEVSTEHHKRLQANLGRLYFGGEATDPEWNGYVEAGLFSGRREALKILKCRKKDCEIYEPKDCGKGDCG